MIIKNKSIHQAISPTAKAGQKQEQDVAFFLRRAFKDHPSVFVLNDYKFTFNEETAQIDHLIIYPYGFILIESKSITGEVKVNELGEWTRSLGNKWSGMPSPIKQVELQQKLLRELLSKNKAKILGKAFGGLQEGFGGRCWDNLCAVSSNAIIHRETMPKEISKQLVKTEFLVEKLESIMKIPHKLVKAINVFDTRPVFNKEDLDSITSFLLPQLKPVEESIKENITENIEGTIVSEPAPVWQQSAEATLACKSCGEKYDYSPQHGRYGYFIKCNKCDTNTTMKMPCPSCSSKNTRVSKKGASYTLSCNECSASLILVS